MNRVETRQWHFHGFAPGGYTCSCATCEVDFTGDKRCITCAECAIRAALSTPEPPISQLMRDDGEPEWKQINALFLRNDINAFPIRLRDELSTMLAWARYGERAALSTAGAAEPGLPFHSDQRAQAAVLADLPDSVAQEAGFLDVIANTLAALSTPAAPELGDGWVMVPKEPNEHQLRQLFSMNSGLPRTTEEAVFVYHAILNCASPQQGDGQ